MGVGALALAWEQPEGVGHGGASADSRAAGEAFQAGHLGIQLAEHKTAKLGSDSLTQSIPDACTQIGQLGVHLRMPSFVY